MKAQKSIAEDTLLVGFSNLHEDDHACLIVGKKLFNGSVEVVNAFQGNEAIELYEKLTSKR